MAILLCKAADSSAPESPAKWRAGEVVTAFSDGHIFGAKELPEAGNFYHITVTDKTVEQVREYLQSWRHNPTVTQVQATGDNRLIDVASDMVSVSGGNAFTRAGVDGVVATLNNKYPDCSAAYQSHSGTSFRFTITAAAALKSAIVDDVYEAVRRMQYRRRRWYVTAAGISFLSANGGAVSGTAAQVTQYLRDGLLD